MTQPLKVLLIGNTADRRCGFANYTQQMTTAMRREPGVVCVPFDGTYSTVYARQQQPDNVYLGMFPDDVLSYDVVHIIWHAATMNHYAGAPWDKVRSAGILTSWWDGGPGDASCPFADHMQIRWSSYPREGYHELPYSVPDWVTDLPEPADVFTVGASSIRGDGIAELTEVCLRQNWALNLPAPGQWLSVEDEVRRLAKSTVNVCWYNTPAIWPDRASAPAMMLAAKRPILINDDHLVAHLHHYPAFQGVFHGFRHRAAGPDMETSLKLIYAASGAGLPRPLKVVDDLSWRRAAVEFVRVWEEAVHGAG